MCGFKNKDVYSWQGRRNVFKKTVLHKIMFLIMVHFLLARQILSDKRLSVCVRCLCVCVCVWISDFFWGRHVRPPSSAGEKSLHPLVCYTTPPGRGRGCSSEASRSTPRGSCVRCVFCAYVRVYVCTYVVCLYLWKGREQGVCVCVC